MFGPVGTDLRTTDIRGGLTSERAHFPRSPMPPRRNSVPSYLHHKASGQARVCVYDAAGKRRMIALGKYGSPESREAYRQVLASLESQAVPPKKIPSYKPARHAAVGEIGLAFLDHAATYYRRADGTRTNEYRLFVDVVAALEPEEDMPAAEFGRAALAAVRDRMLERGWTRQHINSQIRRVRTMWRWAEERELVPEGSWGRLQILRGLSRGRSDAPEQAKVLPVSDADILTTTAHLSPTLARMVRFHRATGCRPQDVCSLRWEEIDRTAAVWVYRPAQHKAAHHGHARTVWIGPAAQVELGPVTTGFVFTPAAAIAEGKAQRRAARQTPLHRAHLAANERKRVLAPKRSQPSYSPQTYGRAITRACERAGVEPWTPNQLRHAALTEFRAKYGLEIARAIGGHKSAVTTEIYAEIPMAAMLAAVGALG